jgi:hypothetical protein
MSKPEKSECLATLMSNHRLKSTWENFDFFFTTDPNYLPTTRVIFKGRGKLFGVIAV